MGCIRTLLPTGAAVAVILEGVGARSAAENPVVVAHALALRRAGGRAPARTARAAAAVVTAGAPVAVWEACAATLLAAARSAIGVSLARVVLFAVGRHAPQRTSQRRADHDVSGMRLGAPEFGGACGGRRGLAGCALDIALAARAVAVLSATLTIASRPLGIAGRLAASIESRAKEVCPAGVDPLLLAARSRDGLGEGQVTLPATGVAIAPTAGHENEQHAQTNHPVQRSLPCHSGRVRQWRWRWREAIDRSLRPSGKLPRRLQGPVEFGSEDAMGGTSEKPCPAEERPPCSSRRGRVSFSHPALTPSEPRCFRRDLRKTSSRRSSRTSPPFSVAASPRTATMRARKRSKTRS